MLTDDTFRADGIVVRSQWRSGTAGKIIWSSRGLCDTGTGARVPALIIATNVGQKRHNVRAHVSI